MKRVMHKPSSPTHRPPMPIAIDKQKRAIEKKRSLLVDRIPKGVAFQPPHARTGASVGGMVAFSGNGFVPDLASEHGIFTLNAASATILETGANVGVPGKEGMMPPPGQRHRVAFTEEGGTGGAGTFNTSIAQPKEIY